MRRQMSDEEFLGLMTTEGLIAARWREFERERGAETQKYADGYCKEPTTEQGIEEGHCNRSREK